MDYEVPDKKITAKIEKYWDDRANGYSISSNYYIENDDGRLISAISNSINLNRSMKVLDVGTGPGDTAIKMAKLGHDVTAMDLSSKMLKKAQDNADKYGVSIRFVKGMAEDPPFDESSFDLIIATSCVWTFRDPMMAYASWKKLLKPGGYIVVYDGNHYLDLFDEDYKNRTNYLGMKYGPNSDRHSKDNVDNVDFNIIRELSKELPMSHFRRPAWDVTTFQGLGATDIRITNMDQELYYVLSSIGRIVVPSKFLICVKFTPDIEEVDEIVATEDIPQIIETVRKTNVDYLDVLKTISDKNRIAIIEALKNGRMNINTLSDVLNLSPPLISYHLSIMKRNNIIYSEKKGKEVYYGLLNKRKMHELLNICKQTKDGLIMGKKGLWANKNNPDHKGPDTPTNLE